MIDCRFATVGTVHLAHPYPGTWTDVFGYIATALRVPLVPYAEWLDRLEADLTDPSHSEVEAATANPALRLMDMFRAYRNGAPRSEAREAMGVPKLQTTQAVRVSPALRRENLPPLGKEDALRWLHYWQRAGLLKTKTLVETSVPQVNGKGAIHQRGTPNLYQSKESTTRLAFAVSLVISFVYALSRF
jgi:hypothetical protein